MSYMHMYFGAPGCGKTTFAAKLVKRYLNLKRPVFTNFPVKGAYRLDETTVGVQELRDCLIIIDEAGLSYNNRDFKTFPRAALEFFKLHRHYGVDVVLFSQGWDDCDKKLRTLCTSYFNMYRIGPFTLVRRFQKRVGIDENTKQIIDEYYKLGIFSRGLQIIYRPRYYNMFDSWDAPRLRSRRPVLWYTERKQIANASSENTSDTSTISETPLP